MKNESLEESISASALDMSHARAIRLGKEASWLTLRGFDGLWSQGECACKVDDLYPCGERQNCQPGYLTTCPPTCGEHDWHIGLKVVVAANDASLPLSAQSQETPK